MGVWGQPAKGRSTGESVASTNKSLTELSGNGSNPDEPSEMDFETLATEVAQRTRELLVTRGWCLWKCSVLGGEVIAVARDENVEGVPEGYTVYTEAELEELCQNGVSEATLRLVHEAKKQARARVVSRRESSEKIDYLDNPDPKPIKACLACGSTNWWQRPDGAWVCGRCHPKTGAARIDNGGT